MSSTPTIFTTYLGHVTYLRARTAFVKEGGDPEEITQGCTLYLRKLAEATNVMLPSCTDIGALALDRTIVNTLNQAHVLFLTIVNAPSPRPQMPPEFAKLAGITHQIRDLPAVAANTLPAPGSPPSQEGPKKKGKKGKQSSKTNGAVLDLSQEELMKKLPGSDEMLVDDEGPAEPLSSSDNTLASTAQAMKEAANRPRAEHNLLDDQAAAAATSRSIQQAASEWKAANSGSREERVKSRSLQLALLQEDKADHMFRMCYYEHWYSRCIQQIRETEELLANDVE
ncbi:hypothetical protein M413DRAFT_25968 [Hebeloma cylindrosporum]|uniref:Uncharacterized protein n=1 Tax=Hebeloma cylindrosporum TaxID=76867 RepID=A0A0C3CIY3_HEBCY|nr:hypothetical protein M413DRAFT_25968 [Hebeloma cylindrosporum h7]